MQRARQAGMLRDRIGRQAGRELGRQAGRELGKQAGREARQAGR